MPPQLPRFSLLSSDTPYQTHIMEIYVSLEFLFPQVNIYYAMSHAPFPGHTIRIKKIITSLVLCSAWNRYNGRYSQRAICFSIKEASTSRIYGILFFKIRVAQHLQRSMDSKRQYLARIYRCLTHGYVTSLGF